MSWYQDNLKDFTPKSDSEIRRYSEVKRFINFITECCDCLEDIVDYPTDEEEIRKWMATMRNNQLKVNEFVRKFCSEQGGKTVKTCKFSSTWNIITAILRDKPLLCKCVKVLPRKRKANDSVDNEDDVNEEEVEEVV